MKTCFKINKRLAVCLVFSLALSPAAHAKKIVLNPVEGVGLHDIMAELSTYRMCMDDAQIETSRGRGGL